MQTMSAPGSDQTQILACSQKYDGLKDACGQINSLANTEMGSAFVTSPQETNLCGDRYDPAILNDVEVKARAGINYDKEQCHNLAVQLLCGVRPEGRFNPSAAARPFPSKNQQKQCYCSIKHACLNTVTLHLQQRPSQRWKDHSQ